jgi:MerR family transcriptional regulator, light-induced transcriptional regulator
MYTIKQASTRSGVSIPLLRAWERRYGIVTPARTAAGYRLYDDRALERLGTMRRLVDAGWTPSTAALAILSDDELPDAGSGRHSPSESVGAGATDPSGPRDDPIGVPADSSGLIGPFVDATVDLDSVALESILDQMLAEGSFEQVAERHLLPALVAIGEGWAAGRVDVAAEHAASQAVLRRLSAAFQAAGRARAPNGAVLVGLPPTARHELGALIFGIAARRAGLSILYLGPDLPIVNWVAAVRRTNAQAAVIWSLIPGDVRPTVDTARALRAARPDLIVAFGGHTAGQALEIFRAADPADGADGADSGLPPVGPTQPGGGRRAVDSAAAGAIPLLLPERLRSAVATLEDALSRGT